MFVLERRQARLVSARRDSLCVAPHAASQSVFICVHLWFHSLRRSRDAARHPLNGKILTHCSRLMAHGSSLIPPPAHLCSSVSICGFSSSVALGTLRVTR